MKVSVLALVAASIVSMAGGSALAQTATPPVTMQPIPNPPEKPVVKAKHHKKAASKPAATDATSAK